MRTVALALLSLLTAAPAVAQDDVTVDLGEPRAPYGFGVGVVVGEPTGLTLAARPNSQRAVQAHASWSFVRDRFRANVDYIETIATAETADVILPFYVGIGGMVGVEEPDIAWIGGRIPVGVAVHPRDIPVEPFLEVAPGLYVLPESAVTVEGSLGVRYYF